MHDDILETTVRMVTEHGLRSATMSQIAEETGIGRATLYKYFSDVEAILVAWHDRHVGDIRGDIASDELAGYCLFALAMASSLRSEAAVRRLVAVILDGLRPHR